MISIINIALYLKVLIIKMQIYIIIKSMHLWFNIDWFYHYLMGAIEKRIMVCISWSVTCIPYCLHIPFLYCMIFVKSAEWHLLTTTSMISSPLFCCQWHSIFCLWASLCAYTYTHALYIESIPHQHSSPMHQDLGICVPRWLRQQTLCHRWWDLDRHHWCNVSWVL